MRQVGIVNLLVSVTEFLASLTLYKGMAEIVNWSVPAST